MELNDEKSPELFKMARVGLGCLGVVTELTLQVLRCPMQHDAMTENTLSKCNLLHSVIAWNNNGGCALRLLLQCA